MTRILPKLQLRLGESPVWDDRENRLFWVDIDACRLFRLDPETEVFEQFDWPEKISCIGLTETGHDLLVAGVSGLWRFDPHTGDKHLWCAFPDLPAGQRPNDGKVGPDGAFWVGTMEDRSDRAANGCLYRFAPDGTVQIMAKGLTTPNGLEWSPDGQRMYRAETRALEIVQYDFNPATGQMSNERSFATLRPEQGKPDGAAVSADGTYWVCGIYAGTIWAFDPDGSPAGAIEVDAEMVTMPCFGGPDLDQLFVTSLSSEGAPDAGLLRMPAPCRGLPTRRFPL